MPSTLDLQVTPVAQDTVSIRSLDWDRDRFDIEFGYGSVCLCLRPAVGLYFALNKGCAVSTINYQHTCLNCLRCVCNL